MTVCCVGQALTLSVTPDDKLISKNSNFPYPYNKIVSSFIVKAIGLTGKYQLYLNTVVDNDIQFTLKLSR